MTVARIRNKLVRRIAVVAVCLSIAPLMFVFHIAGFAWALLCDGCEGVRDAWQGRL